MKRSLKVLIFVFVLINILAYSHSYHFTHFSNDDKDKTKDPHHLTLSEKARTLLLGVHNPRPRNMSEPSRPYETITIQSNKRLECWLINMSDSKGTVILFHGYGGQKSALLDKADIFLKLGYNTLLVDFKGSGRSEGNQTTIGYSESIEVKDCFDFIKSRGEKNIYLFGTSMGAVAILKSLYDYSFDPTAIIIECPFGSMYQTVCARFHMMNIPTFPMAGLLVFWGGIQNGFWAFGHNPTKYAKRIKSPTLLMYGSQDEKVSREEIDAIFENINGPKQLKIYPLAGHENYLNRYKSEWAEDISLFLKSY